MSEPPWSEGTHAYHFEAQRAAINNYLEGSEIQPNQATRFLPGYVTPGPTWYADAVTFFANLTARAVWDGNPAPLARNEIVPFSTDNTDAWTNYVCTFTGAP